ncbi:LPS export ABC transporter permease LptG [Agrobacterium tumefaciens]|uniref:LPS export ABC transporter permease LptG n=1 Tax=Agrobacterium tumefaciens TaxID=358 RepID=UPI00287CDFBE|nr:LPS export ABC transporter permease LptG [Agrobacterium tumefaciens]MDS7596676.1 LPS export ABC transporter permease LptG [Agrobacterium tumefaciens]
MIFNTLARYFLKRYLMTAVWFVLGVSAIIYLADFSETARRMSNLPGYSVPAALGLTALRLPLILQQTVPFIALFVGMTTLISLNRRYELVVTRAAGISAWQFILPFVLGSVLIGVMSVTILNPIAAWGQNQSLSMEAGWRNEANGGRQQDIIPWIRQSSGGQDTIIGAKSFEDNGTLLLDVVLVHLDKGGNIISRQDAKSAKLEDGYWLLNGVTETRPGHVPVRQESTRISTNLRQEFVQERMTQAETVAFFDLSRKIEIARSFGLSSKALETQYHFLLSTPLLLVAMTLIAATVSLKFSRFAQSRSVILGGIVSGFVLYVVTVLVRAFGSSGVVPPFVAVWVPVTVALALGATILLHQEDG